MKIQDAREIIFYVRLSSSGCRKTSRTWRRNSGNSSRKSTPWCARDTSPGLGTWPPPISSASERVWWGVRYGRARDQRCAVPGEARDAVNARGLNGLGQGHRRQDGGEPPGQHRCARPWRSQEEDIMGRTPASASPWHLHPSAIVASAVELAAACHELYQAHCGDLCHLLVPWWKVGIRSQTEQRRMRTFVFRKRLNFQDGENLTPEILTESTRDLLCGQFPIRLPSRPFGMSPTGLNIIQPGACNRQFAGVDLHSSCALDPLIVDIDRVGSAARRVP